MPFPEKAPNSGELPNFGSREQHWPPHSDNHRCESRVIWAQEVGIFHLHKCHGVNAVLLGVVDSLESWGVNDEFHIYRVILIRVNFLRLCNLYLS